MHRALLLDEVHFSSRQPKGALSSLVSAVWLYEGQVAHAMERVIPNGCMQLLVNLHEDEMSWWDGPKFAEADHLSGAALSGAFARPFAIDTRDQRSITGVTFQPGGAHAFFDVSMHELNHDHVDLADLACGDIRAKLLEARQRGPDAVLATWTRFLNERCKKAPRRRALLACARLDKSDSVRDVAAEMGISVRTLRNGTQALRAPFSTRRFRFAVRCSPSRTLTQSGIPQCRRRAHPYSYHFIVRTPMPSPLAPSRSVQSS